ncbi:ferrous iron transport protein B [Clostridia bacterium]|nr:ferrous iron transport protein B [Clostridia bacterium]
MAITIALAGNPNSGKTTMFNDLTGSSQHTGNWPGVTVEKKEGRLKGHREVVLQDLPGIYSLSPYSPEEIVSRSYLVNDRPDAIINIVDASNVERNLYLTTQLLELGIPVVVALNMIDVVRKTGDEIDVKKLEQALGCEIVETCALRGEGSVQAAERAVALAKNAAVTLTKNTFAPSKNTITNTAGNAHTSSLSKEAPRFLNRRTAFSNEVEAALDSIGSLVRELGAVKDKVAGKINNGEAYLRWLSIKLFERDAEAAKDAGIADTAEGKRVLAEIEKITTAVEDKLDDDSESIITDGRYNYISDIVKQTVKRKNAFALTLSDRIDRVVTNRILALPIFAGVMFLVYFIAVSTVGAWGTDWVNDVLFGSLVPDGVANGLAALGTAGWLNGLILDGIIAGVGAVIGFLPQMLVLFVLLAFLEDCGYMARIAFILDRIFRRFGLSGKSFIPILVGTGCGVPGIMASRTIESDNDRRMTVMTTTFIPCGAKLPIIALIAGALFPGSMWVAPSAYFLGIFAILVSGIMLKKLKRFSGRATPFVMELPAYHLPTPGGVLRTMLERGLAFVKRAGTIVLAATVLVWFLSSFDTSMQMVDTTDSILAIIGDKIAVIFSPLGWGDWRAAVATITGLIAKENVVGTFGVLYGFAEVAEDGAEYWPQLIAAFTPLAAYAFLAFNLLCAPCFAAIGAIHREMMDVRWTLFAVAYQCGFAYVISLIIFQMGRLFGGGGFTVGSAVAIVFILTLVWMIGFKKPYAVPAGERLSGAPASEVA